eukprot:SAG11_NODE_12033_length_725_cov_0.982428_1_plen_29_part_10
MKTLWVLQNTTMSRPIRRPVGYTDLGATD